MDDTNIRTFTLGFPIVVADAVVHPAGTVITVRKPVTGELMGLQAQLLIQGDYTQMSTLAARITSPRLLKPHFAAMDPSDATQLNLEVLDFLLPSTAKQAVSHDE